MKNTTCNLNSLIEKTKQFVRAELMNDITGHDYWHCIRVWRNAKYISESEKVEVNLVVVELAALLHDIEDWKLGSINEGKINKWLNELGVDKKTISDVYHIITKISFKGLGVKNQIKSIEGKIVQDADRLDAIGAIGIARAFAYGGSKNRNIFDPEEKPVFHNSFDEYKNSNSSTINHFQEKLLYLKDLMNTETAKKLAEKRHKLMTDFLDDFHSEWNLNNEFDD